MDYVTYIIKVASDLVYPLQGITAVYGAFCLVLIYRRVRVKQFRNAAAAERFLEEVREKLDARDFARVAETCDSPPYWAKIVPQLILVSLNNLDRDPSSLRRLLAEKFERDVLADMEYRMTWVNTVVKTAPMLGLLGTVLGMIAAFAKIASATQQGNPAQQLASDISFALYTTAVGLIIAIPLIMVANSINVRIARMQDNVQYQLGIFLEAFDRARLKKR